jgi:hypothetical protein
MLFTETIFREAESCGEGIYPLATDVRKAASGEGRRGIDDE